MSQDYHHHPGLFSFSNGFERSPAESLQQHHHVVQQIRRDKLPPPPEIEEDEQLAGGNETSGMLSEMFNFQHGTARELLESQISQGFHHHHGQQQSQQQMAAAMQLFLMNPSQARSPSPSPPAAAAATLHMSSVPNPSPTSTLQGFHTPTGGHFSQFAWGNGGPPNAVAGEGQGLSLSLSSSLQRLDAAKAGEEFRISGDPAGMLFFSQGMASAPSEYPCKNNQHLTATASGGGVVTMDHHHIGFGSSIGVINGLRHSKYAKPAQELLDEFCSVVVTGHHQFNKNKPAGLNPNSNPTSSDAVDGGDAPNNNSSSSSKPTPPPLSTADRIEHQRRKVKLLSMLDEVDRRYNRYCEQMQMVVNSFDLVMGFGAAAPYTVQAQKAMSRHFRCLKDAVAAQLKHSCEMLGEKDGGASGLTKGETPRLKMLEQSLRQQRAFHQMGMMEPEAWRPQRGLPERSVNALRAWLFEHFLHPYPSDADKHMLARQTGLSRSQVSNWFINARVRLWKPMVEEMYQQEVKVGDDDSENIMDSGDDDTVAQTPTPNAVCNSPTTTVTTTPPPSVTATSADAVVAAAAGKRSEINAAHESDSSQLAINTQYTCHRRGTADSGGGGNVSLTLGLRHAGNLPDQNHFFG
ncbi:BEL1-like homeodomain protein 2 [Ipomoea triloba]|uniref:BEL1-like homeodomain protein 2 n=1 Tax=Ipomoea triloba TaxID=35885 RepID=UPI00125E212A|nr:BEL1-like homeodomain protein 2 [Ipomoea triloba]